MMSYLLTGFTYFFLCLVLLRVLHLVGERVHLQGIVEWGIAFFLGGVGAYAGLRLLTGNTLNPIIAFVFTVAALMIYDWLQSWYDIRH